MLISSWISAAIALAPAGFQTVEGTASYRERMALPRDAELIIQVSRYGSESQTLVVETRYPVGNRSVPLPYAVSFPSTRLSRGERLGVRAEIRTTDRVWFQSASAAMISSNATTSRVPLNLIKAGPPPYQLTGKAWQLVELDGKRVNFSDRIPSLTFGTDGKINGFGGVNRFGGSYTGRAPQIQIDPGAMTMMAGPPERQLVETQFVEILPRINRATLVEGELILWRGEKRLARFVATR